MDLLLEVLDNLVLDKAYAKLLPKSLEASLPTVPAIFQDWSDGVNNSTVFTESTQGKILSTLVSLIPQTGEVYAVNTPYKFLGETVYTHASLLSRSNLIRQFISLLFTTSLFGWLLYFTVASFSFFFVYDKNNFNHPLYLKNQVSKEIWLASTSIPGMVALTVPWFLAELHGYGLLYWDVNAKSGGWKEILFEIPADIMFTDAGIYLIHRWLHWPAVYKALHKPHHKWIVCTPYASHAFHPVDGYFQSLPYHWYPFLFPLHKITYLFMFTFVNFWTVMIHDGQYLSNDPVINGAACHTVHHLYFNYDYGQFTTLWDRLGGTYRKPEKAIFEHSDNKKDAWSKQVTEMNEIRKEVEGDKDERVYGSEEEFGNLFKTKKE